MDSSIHFEIGAKYQIIYSDGTTRTFLVEGGPVPQASFDDENDFTDLSNALKYFISIIKIS